MMKKNNVIPRKATYIKYIKLVKSNAGKAGDIFEARKDERGWHSQNITKNDGIIWFTFAQHLRNEHYTRFIEIY